MKKISAHFLVKNEERFIWYSIMSVIEHVDKVLIWDSGSTDKTKEIIKKLKIDPRFKNKIYFKEIKGVEFDEAVLRQQMLKETDTDWFIVVDGDEIWWEDSIKKVIGLIVEKGDDLESIVVPMILPVGDIFHYQDNLAGRYKFGNKFGHFALRAINKNISGLSSNKPHGQWGWTDDEGKMIQDRDPKRIGFVDAPYLHVTHLQRSIDNKDSKVIKRKMKLKHELGIEFPKDFYYPEAFFKVRHNFVKSPWRTMGLKFKLRAFFETPLRKIKRKLIYGKAGY